MSYTLRPYQQEMSDIMVKLLSQGTKRPFVLQAATGAGKSLVIADAAHRLGGGVLVLAPSKELLEQDHAKMQSYGIDDIGIYSASKNSREIGNFCIATIGSIYKKPELFQHFKHIIIDECDVVPTKNLGSMYRQFFDAIGSPNIVGLTATPYRIQSKYVNYLGELWYTSTLKVINRIGFPGFWGNIVYKIETQELIDQGFLSPIVYHTDNVQLDALTVNTTGADFTAESLESWGETRTERIVNVAKAVDPQCQRNLIFVGSVSMCERVQDRLAAEGITAHVVTAKTPKNERERLIDEYRAGKFKHLIGVGVFLAGFDVPELDSIIFARPTMSLRVWYQAIGRGVRLDPNRPTKKLHVFDLAGVTERMGRVETIRLGKEPPPNHFKDTVESEVGRIDEQPLFSFKVKKKMFVKEEK